MTPSTTRLALLAYATLAGIGIAWGATAHADNLACAVPTLVLTQVNIEFEGTADAAELEAWTWDDDGRLDTVRGGPPDILLVLPVGEVQGVRIE